MCWAPGWRGRTEEQQPPWVKTESAQSQQKQLASVGRHCMPGRPRGLNNELSHLPLSVSPGSTVTVPPPTTEDLRPWISADQGLQHWGIEDAAFWKRYVVSRSLGGSPAHPSEYQGPISQHSAPDTTPTVFSADHQAWL